MAICFIFRLGLPTNWGFQHENKKFHMKSADSFNKVLNVHITELAK
jgi:hypothetical protein